MVSPDQAPILIGHSWGAMLVAAYLGQNPNAAHSAVLIEPGYPDSAGRAAWEAESAPFMSGFRYGWQAITMGFRAQHVLGPDDAAQDDFLFGHMVGLFANHPDNPYHCGGGYTAPSWRFGALSSTTWRDAPAATVDKIGANLAAFRGPVLLLAGECDDWLGPLQSEHLARFANAELATIAGAGHDVVWDNGQATLAEIRRFLNE
ncbi:MAG TPA: alpha/beta hydrolase [Aliiroseovarius sp.]|nr:alpha/beta hydrolase [Aliiroseovarius sp.]